MTVVTVLTVVTAVTAVAVVTVVTVVAVAAVVADLPDPRSALPSWMRGLVIRCVCFLLARQVMIISKIHHRNVVRLLGYCTDGAEQILIMEYVPGGTLKEHLHPKGMAQGARDLVPCSGVLLAQR